VTHEEYELQFADVFDQIAAYAAGSPINVINPEALEHARQKTKVAAYVSSCLYFISMEAALRAIAEPRRRRILELVAERELSAGEIAERFEVTRPAISQHLTVLKGAGLVSERRDGTRRMYRARPEGLDEVRGFLDRFWTNSLTRLKAAAEQAEREERR
jgi:DNA-binding transcriptional ArsR family regulator